ncbi:leucine zipper domain-containing protein [Blastococcus mobilis]|uniref:leucine zipper domain-containing protein n=1 Tax=Blastococcus mobilis TaxID=1938746 RepID=UPI000B780EBC|nr:leucine zipper domain-containing protein [Blastococcus mobilis]
MLHADAVLTPRQRLRLAWLILEEKWPVARAADSFGVGWKTAAKWAARYRAEGQAGMADRSSRPHSSPAKTGPATTKRIMSRGHASGSTSEDPEEQRWRWAGGQAAGPPRLPVRRSAADRPAVSEPTERPRAGPPRAGRRPPGPRTRRPPAS